jgi:hypothetical protein
MQVGVLPAHTEQADVLKNVLQTGTYSQTSKMGADFGNMCLFGVHLAYISHYMEYI